MANESVRLAQSAKKARAKATTTNATPATLAPDFGNFVLPNNSAWIVEAKVIGRKSDGSDVGAYLHRCVVKRNANAASTALVGSVTTTVIAESDSTWDSTIAANTTTGGFGISVTGVAATTIAWSAQVSLVQVGG